MPIGGRNMEKTQVVIKGRKIPLVVRSYKTSRSIKAYYKGDVLYISKPCRVPLKEVDKFINNYETFLYAEYMKIKSDKNLGIKKWVNGEKISYKGKEYTIITDFAKGKSVEVKINDRDRFIYINTPQGLGKEERTEAVLKAIKKEFKKNTEQIIEDKLNYWSFATGIEYNSFKVHDATTRYGSCVKSRKALNFSSRLVMLPSRIIDAIVVHELCHIEQANHGPKFYGLVEKYMPDYKEADRWLKENNNLLNL